MIGKTASGKTVVRDKLKSKYGYELIITYTTRPMRQNEKQDITYHFINEEDFKQKIEEGFFAEWKKYETVKGCWYYGTALEDCKNADNNSVIILTPQGAEELKSKKIDAKIVYLYSNLSTIGRRLAFRGDAQAEIDRRIKADIGDFKDADILADRIIYNNLSDNTESVVENIDYWYKKILKEKSNEK